MSREKKTILIIDDEPDWIQFVEAVIGKVGDFSVISASDGESGLKKAISEAPDLLILDVMMPRKDGFAVFYDLRSNPKTEHIPVIMLTGVSEKSGIKFSSKAMGDFMGEKPQDFTDKPVDSKKLEAAIKRALEME